MSLENAVKVLNEVLVTDHDFLADALFKRFPCSDKLIIHPTVQVREEDNKQTVSVLGLMNGLLSENGKVICAIINYQCPDHPNELVDMEDKQCTICGKELNKIKISGFAIYNFNDRKIEFQEGDKDVPM